MFRSPSRPTRSEDDESTGAGRPLRNTPVTPAGPRPTRTRPAPCRSDARPANQPAWVAVDPSTPTTHLAPP